MKSALTFLCISLFTFFGSAQMYEESAKELIKIADEDLVQLPFRDSLPASVSYHGVEVDTSLTKVGDTVGISLNGEYLSFRSALTTPWYHRNFRYRYIRPTAVTVREYEEFMQYIQDSIALEKMYFGFDDDDQASCILSYDEYYFDEEELEYVEYDRADRIKSREVFVLNWKKKFRYTDPEIVPILADMYLPPYERVYRKKEIDQRKLIYDFHCIRRVKNPMYDSTSGRGNGNYEYKYRVIEERVPVMPDDYQWAIESEHLFDEYAILSQVYRHFFKDSPMVGLTGEQAKAYCRWREINYLQAVVRETELITPVQIDLPIAEDYDLMDSHPAQIELVNHDYTDQWQITVGEYDEFREHVLDSVLREYLFSNLSELEEAAEFLSHSDIYFDESSLEYREFDPADKVRIRDAFSLNYRTKIKMNDPEVAQLVTDFYSSMIGKTPAFEYAYIDVKRRSEVGPVTIVADSNYGDFYQSISMQCMDEDSGETWECYGKNIILDQFNEQGQSSGVRAHDDLGQFIVQKWTVVNPESTNENEDKKALRTGITYEQALAFYHWKYPIHKITKKSKWTDFVFPSRSQFETLQRGERIPVEVKIFAMPTSTFRYVIHLY